MDLSQTKLSKNEWNNTEVPITEGEKFILNVLMKGYDNLNIRDNSTIIRKMEEYQNQVTAGQRLVSIKVSADLEVSDKVTLRAFYDQQLTSPKISTSFATSNINSGVAIRFNLNQ